MAQGFGFGAAASIGWEIGWNIGNNVDEISYKVGSVLVDWGVLSPEMVAPEWAISSDGEKVISFPEVQAIVSANLAKLDMKDFRIALGVDEYLLPFSESVNAIPYSTWAKGLPTTKSAYRAGIIFLGTLPHTTFHINLATPKGSLIDPFNMSYYSDSFTLMEYTITKTAFGHKTYEYNQKFD